MLTFSKLLVACGLLSLVALPIPRAEAITIYQVGNRSNQIALSYSHDVMIKSASLEQFVNRIQTSPAPLRLIFIFTSWCSSCHRNLGEVLKIREELKDHLEIFFLSLDHNDKQLADSISSKVFSSNTAVLAKEIEVYHPYTGPDTNEIFNLIGINYRNSIPHFTLLDNSNKVLLDAPVSMWKVKNKILALINNNT